MVRAPRVPDGRRAPVRTGHAGVRLRGSRGTCGFICPNHEGDAHPGSLVYLFVGDDLDAIAKEFGTHVHDNEWGRDLELNDPDGNRLRVGGGRADTEAAGRISVDAVAKELPGPWEPRDLVAVNDAVVRIARLEGEFP